MSPVNSACTKDQDVLVTGILTCNWAEIATSLEVSISVLTLLVSIGAFFLLSPWLEVPFLGLRWEKKAQEVLLAAATSPHSSKCGPNEYFSRLAIFMPLLACRINRVAKLSLGAALIHSRITIWDILGSRGWERENVIDSRYQILKYLVVHQNTEKGKMWGLLSMDNSVKWNWPKLHTSKYPHIPPGWERNFLTLHRCVHLEDVGVSSFMVYPHCSCMSWGPHSTRKRTAAFCEPGLKALWAGSKPHLGLFQHLSLGANVNNWIVLLTHSVPDRESKEENKPLQQQLQHVKGCAQHPP